MDEIRKLINKAARANTSPETEVYILSALHKIVDELERMQRERELERMS